jgi:hypothetical protein
MKNVFLLLMALVVLAASVWLAITSLRPAKHKTLSPIDAAATAHALEVAASHQSPTPRAPSPSPALSPTPVAEDGAQTSNLPRETPSSSPWPAATVQPSRKPEKKALASSLFPKESSPPLLAPALPPGINFAHAKQAAAEQPIGQTYNNAETSNFEPTTLTVVRTFVLSLPDGSQVEQSVSIPVLYRKGSIALKSDQLEQLGVVQSQIQRILDANEELRVAADLLISRQRKSLSGSVPAEVLSARSSSVLPGGPINPGTNYVNVPQGSVEIAPAKREP